MIANANSTSNEQASDPSDKVVRPAKETIPQTRKGKPSLPTPANNAIAPAKSAPQPAARSPQPAALEGNSIGMLFAASEQGQFGATTAED